MQLVSSLQLLLLFPLLSCITAGFHLPCEIHLKIFHSIKHPFDKLNYLLAFSHISQEEGGSFARLFRSSQGYFVSSLESSYNLYFSALEMPMRLFFSEIKYRYPRKRDLFVISNFAFPTDVHISGCITDENLFNSKFPWSALKTARRFSAPRVCLSGRSAARFFYVKLLGGSVGSNLRSLSLTSVSLYKHIDLLSTLLESTGPNLRSLYLRNTGLIELAEYRALFPHSQRFLNTVRNLPRLEHLSLSLLFPSNLDLETNDNIILVNDMM